MFNYIFKRTLYKFSKINTFENILPFKSELYFRNLINTHQTFYLGFDPTANSLQIGNLFPLIALLRIWKTGHNIIALIGGATGQIGDPTGRISDREELSHSMIVSNSDQIARDITRIIKNFKLHFLNNEEIGDFKLLDNKDWYQDKNLLYFVTDVLKHFRFHDVKNKRSFENRLASENSMNMSEFLYPFLQAYDWLHLYRQYGCRVQIGGDDQQGNMQLGQILIKESEKENVYGLTVPLFLVNGEKIGKSSNSSHLKLWLNPEVQSPYSLYYSLMHVSNGIIIKNGLLKRLTLLEDNEIELVMQQHKLSPNKSILQTTLADQVLTLVHGDEILRTVKIVHGIFSLSQPELIRQQLIPLNVSNIILDNISSVPHISVDSSNKAVTFQELMSSTSARDTITSNMTVKFNGETINDISQSLNMQEVNQRICGVLQIGSSNKWIVHCRN